MKKIQRYFSNEPEGGVESEVGVWCRWSDVEVLQKEVQELRTQLLATIMLLPPETTMNDIEQYVVEARELFLGKDKQTIAKLEDELRNTREEHHRAKYPLRPGVNAVFGVKPGGREYTDIRVALMLTSITQAPNGGLEIEVRLP